MQIAVLVGGRSIQELDFDSTGNYTGGVPMTGQQPDTGRVGNVSKLVELLRERYLAAAASDRSAIRRAVETNKASRVVVTQVVEAVLDTAQILLDVPGKSIVLTEMLDFGKPANANVSFNLGIAVGVVQVLPPGIYVIADGQVLPAARVRMNSYLGKLEAVQ